MSADLRDQLMKAGLVTAEQVKAADEKKPARGGGRNKPGQKRGAKNQRTAAADQKRSSRRDGNGNAAKKDKIVKVDPSTPLKQRVMELIEKNSRNDKRAESSYFFTDPAGEVREIKTTKQQQKLLAQGELAVVTPQQLRDPYVLIPAVVAAEVKELMPHRIVMWHKAEESGEGTPEPS